MEVKLCYNSRGKVLPNLIGQGLLKKKQRNHGGCASIERWSSNRRLSLSEQQTKLRSKVVSSKKPALLRLWSCGWNYAYSDEPYHHNINWTNCSSRLEIFLEMSNREKCVISAAPATNLNYCIWTEKRCWGICIRNWNHSYHATAVQAYKIVTNGGAPSLGPSSDRYMYKMSTPSVLSFSCWPFINSTTIRGSCRDTSLHPCNVTLQPDIQTNRML